MSDEMSDEDVKKLLRASLHSEKDLQGLVPEGEEFPSPMIECPPEAVERMHAGFVKKVFCELNREPVRQIQEKLPFGRWIESERNRARLIREDVATALGKDPSFVERLEKGEILPWILNPVEAADVVCLFRIHINAVRWLISISLAVSNLRRQVERLAARADEGDLPKKRTENLESALDFALAHEAGHSELNEEIDTWLTELRKELQRRQVVYLLE